MSYGKTKLLVCGALIGSVGIQLLTGKTAKKVYTHVTAAVLREKEYIMKKVSTCKENCNDILEDAKEINETKFADDDVIDDSVIFDESESAETTGA